MVADKREKKEASGGQAKNDVSIFLTESFAGSLFLTGVCVGVL